MERTAGAVHTPGSPAAQDKVIVAVDEENGRSRLRWALRNLAKEGTVIVIAHVHCPAQTVPVKVGQIRVIPQAVNAHPKDRAKSEQKLDEYIQICTRQKELIALYAITKLVVGAAADERYSNALYSWARHWSKAAHRLMTAESNCKIWFTCRGHLICTREGNRNYFSSPPSSIEKALCEVEYFKEKAYEESTKRQKAELDLRSAHVMIGEWKLLHQRDKWQRQGIEELRLRGGQEVTEMIRQFEAAYDQLHDAQELKRRVIEMESAKQYHEGELAASRHLVEMLQADKKKLMRCLEEEESARKYHEEELATSKCLVEILQADKEKLQRELDAALTEAEDLHHTRWLSPASETNETSPPSYFICPISQEMMNDPHIAADGFTYEGEEIRGWLNSGHDTSPMTNLKLANTVLTPNRALRSAILEWQQQQR